MLRRLSAQYRYLDNIHYKVLGSTLAVSQDISSWGEPSDYIPSPLADSAFPLTLLLRSAAFLAPRKSSTVAQFLLPSLAPYPVFF